jgi:hypothetical protein
MSVKSIRSVPATKEAAADSSPWNFAADWSRQQLAVATAGAGAWFRGCEAMRKIQQHAAHQAGTMHEAASRKLQGPCEASDLLAVQSELLRSDFQGAGQYWQQLLAATLKMQVEMLASASHLADGTAGAAFKPALDAWQAAVTGSPAAER